MKRFTLAKFVYSSTSARYIFKGSSSSHLHESTQIFFLPTVVRHSESWERAKETSVRITKSRNSRGTIPIISAYLWGWKPTLSHLESFFSPCRCINSNKLQLDAQSPGLKPRKRLLAHCLPSNTTKEVLTPPEAQKLKQT